MKLVVKIGGSLCFDEDGPMKSYFLRLLPVLRKVKKNNQLIVAIGGGRQNRRFYRSIEEFHLTDEQKEWIAIDMLRANARFLAYLLRMEPLFSIEEIGRSKEGVISGIAPGRSTDANAAEAAAIIRADLLVKLTNVDGIYNRDPNRFKGASKLDYVRFSELKKYSKSGKPGSYGILDGTAMDIIVKNKIRTVVMSGEDPRDLLGLLKGRTVGTLVS